MTKENEWYKNRILWKAKKYLFDYGCMEFEDLKENAKNCIQKLISKEDIPIIVFFESSNKWTVLCTQSLCSYHDNTFYSVSKANLEQKIYPYIEKGVVLTKNSDKRKVHWLKMNETGEYIWLPSSEALWNFWGILPMLAKLSAKV